MQKIWFFIIPIAFYFSGCASKSLNLRAGSAGGITSDDFASSADSVSGSLGLKKENIRNGAVQITFVQLFATDSLQHKVALNYPRKGAYAIWVRPLDEVVANVDTITPREVFADTNGDLFVDFAKYVVGSDTILYKAAGYDSAGSPEVGSKFKDLAQRKYLLELGIIRRKLYEVRGFEEWLRKKSGFQNPKLQPGKGPWQLRQPRPFFLYKHARHAKMSKNKRGLHLRTERGRVMTLKNSWDFQLVRTI